jgi:membrane-bound metal-dependent hydrolase YbcI (DUF457 family)
VPDLLAHALIAYSLCRVCSWRYDWLTTPYVTVGMVGAFIPDLVKVRLLVPSWVIERALGLPFNWGSFHTGGGAALSVLVGVVLLRSTDRRRGGAVLALGAGSHLLADSLLLNPARRTVQLFWPLSQYRVHSPGLYLSTQPEPTAVAGAVALAVYLVHRRVGGQQSD